MAAGMVAAQSPVPAGSEAEKVAEGFQFVEGPVWMNGALLFSDIPANKVYQWTEESGESVFLSPSGNSNGLCLDRQGRLLLAQHGNRRVARLEEGGTQTALATHYDGKRLNSPNDMTVALDGSIYFTDPPYGLSNPSSSELGYSGIYRIAPDGTLTLLDKTLYRPNGIALSPDEKKLYVNDSESRKIYRWDMQADFTAVNRTLFYSMTGSGAADGMKVDTEGRLYSSGPGGVWIFAPDGTLLDKIPVPESVTNCNWGDEDRKALYITAGGSVYRIRLDAAGTAVNKPGTRLPGGFGLYPNYPNPFNPVTRISYELPSPGTVQFRIFDVSGRLVSFMDAGIRNEGLHFIEWDGKDRPAGQYACRMDAPGFSGTIKMTLVR
jgi:gluconolactonase